MFAKLIKHEFRATRPAMMVLCLTALVMGLVGGGAWWINSESGSAAVKLVCALVLFASFLLIAMCSAAVFFLMVARFYKRCFTDEGYLTFTLPVSRHQVLLSSMLNAVINLLIAFVTVLVSFGILTLFGACIAGADFGWIVGEMLPELFAIIRDAMTWEIAGYLALALLNMGIGGILELILIMLSITIGALVAKKHKILMGVGVYYGFSVLIGFLSAGMTGSLIARQTDHFGGQFLVMSAAMFGILAVGGYFLMYHLVNRKLNLP